MKKNFLTGFLTGALIFGSVTSFAMMSYQAYVADFNVMLNGEKWTCDKPIVTIEGSTYLPLKALGDALNVKVNWNNDLRQVEIGDTPVIGFDSSTVAKQIEVINEYKWDSYSYHHLAIAVKNASEYKVAPRVQLTLKDESGNVIGVKNESEAVLGSQDEMLFVFSNEESFDSYDYKITVDEVKYYDDCVANLDKKVNITDRKAIIQVTNNGNKAAQFVEYTVLFFKGDKVVDYGRGYCVDSDSEIKPGQTELKEETCYESFDSAKVYLTARADK